MKKVFETYRAKKKVKAILYKKGLEDGFSTRFVDEEDYEDFKLGKIDCLPTFGIGGDVEVKVPYFKAPGGTKLPWGHQYYIIKDGKTFYSMHKKDFKKKYEKEN